MGRGEAFRHYCGLTAALLGGALIVAGLFAVLSAFIDVVPAFLVAIGLFVAAGTVVGRVRGR